MKYKMPYASNVFSNYVYLNCYTSFFGYKSLPLINLSIKYSILHPKAGRSGIQMVISRTLFESGFRILALDRFGMNKIFVLLIKRSRLGPTIRKPDLCLAFEW
jgi:hypothetical protein